MKKTISIFLVFLLLLIVYSTFLRFFPLNKTVFYTNEERVEEFVYSKQNYTDVIVGSSLCGIFENKQIFSQPYFNLFLPNTGACSGIEIISRINRVPQKLFIEINHADRGVDEVLMHNIFDQPFYSLKTYLPLLLKKNKLLTNLIDRVKAPHNNIINQQQPPPVLYDALLASTQKEWNKKPDTAKLNKVLAHATETLDKFAAQGCQIYFFEMPMDSTLKNSVLLTYQRNYFVKLAKNKGYRFIAVDPSRNYTTGDGVHLLKGEGDIYIDYFLRQIK